MTVMPPVRHGPPAADTGSSSDAALLQLLAQLRADGYAFITPTPSTHQRVVQRRREALARDVRDVLGWSLPFTPDVLGGRVFALLEAADLLAGCAQGFRCKIRVSSLGEDLFAHSAYPTTARDAVFLGPDTYRFAAFLQQQLAEGPPPARLVDIGAGSGAGAVVAAKAAGAGQVIATDINPQALRLARVNLAAAGVAADLRLGPGLEAAPEMADLIIANPPFIADDAGPTYRAGGDMHGARLSLDWALQASARLSPGGRFLLYTGSAIVGGEDRLRDALVARLDPDRFSLAYREIDPDIFGEQLDEPGYEEVERIAAIGAVIRRR